MPLSPTYTLSGWGRQFVPASELLTEDLVSASADAVLLRGLGRSYGDSSLPPADNPVAVNTTLADSILSFDRHTGVIRAEAGLSLHTLNRLFLKEHRFTPVTPGTEYVTLGGMVAADVHGKNHHIAGTFGKYLRSLKIRTGAGEILDCSPTSYSDLFYATIGGMGLTGHILEVEFALERIPSRWIKQEMRLIWNIGEFVQQLTLSAKQWSFTVGWVDCLTTGDAMGRGILYCGNWCTGDESPAQLPEPPLTIPLPFVLPDGLLNRYTSRLFNMGKYRTHFPPIKTDIVTPYGFFYPLDRITNWNRMYGKRGFTQYQCVLPEYDNGGVTRRFFELLTRLGGASFLCVIKDCGSQGDGILSFPMRGISVALDIPVRRDTAQLVCKLNEFIIPEGGRIYLAKDQFTRPEHYRAMEPRLSRFEEIRHKYDPERRIRSAQSVRLLGD